MGKMILVLGGARSGKSAQALKLAQKKKQRVAYVATGEPKDEEMVERIRHHREDRPAQWATFEEPANLSLRLVQLCGHYDVIIVDCLTLWVSNLYLKKKTEEAILSQAQNTISAVKKGRCTTIFVSNEVGLGIVPDNRMAREFRDIAGRVNQMFAKDADQVFFMVAGIAWRVK